MKTLKFLLLALASATLVAACGGGDDDSFDDRADIADPKLRFVHAAEGAPAVTLSRNGTAESNATNVGYRYASRYYDVSNGGTNLVLRTASGGVQVDDAVSFDARQGNRYTLVALPDPAGVDLLFIADPYNKSVTSNDARVRVVNSSVNAQNLDIYLTAPGVDIATVGPNIAAVPYKQARPASGSDSLSVEGRAYQVRATPAGSKTVIFSTVLDVPANADWLLVSLPTSLVPNAIKMLLVRADDPSNTATEIATAP